MQPKIKLFLEGDEGLVFGPGRMELLLAVDALGSLRKAAQKLGMSYRWAWGRMNDAEKALGVPLLTVPSGAGGGRSKVLTEEARALLAWFTLMEQKATEALKESEALRPSFIRTAPALSGKRAAGKKTVLD